MFAFIFWYCSREVQWHLQPPDTLSGL